MVDNYLAKLNLTLHIISKRTSLYESLDIHVRRRKQQVKSSWHLDHNKGGDKIIILSWQALLELNSVTHTDISTDLKCQIRTGSKHFSSFGQFSVQKSRNYYTKNLSAVEQNLLQGTTC